jgi:hypothetical protein
MSPGALTTRALEEPVIHPKPPRVGRFHGITRVPCESDAVGGPSEVCGQRSESQSGVAAGGSCRLLASSRDVGVEVVAVDADVLAELDDGDAAFGAEPADEPGGGAEAFGGLVDG